MRALVDRRINQNIEPVHLSYFLSPLNGTFPSATYDSAYTIRPGITDLSMFFLLPAIKQRNTSIDPFAADYPVRKGDEIVPQYLSVRIRMWLNPDDVEGGLNSNRWSHIHPWVFIGRSKLDKSFADWSDGIRNAALCNTLWEHPENIFGNTPTSTAPPIKMVPGNFNGSNRERVLGRMNRDRLDPYHVWEPRLNRDVPYFFPNAVEGVGVAQVRTHFYEKVFKIPCPKKLYFEQPNDRYPKNWAPFVTIGFNPTNGRQSDNETEDILSTQISAKFVYTDAGS